jgi:hypothetical protein
MLTAESMAAAAQQLTKTLRIIMSVSMTNGGFASATMPRCARFPTAAE